VEKPVPGGCSLGRPRRGLYNNIVTYLKGAVCKDGGRVSDQHYRILKKKYLNFDIITTIFMQMITM
jgi:hypothetical protein